MWRNRNDIEHSHDLQKATEIIDRTIADEIEQGDNNNADIARMIANIRMLTGQDRTFAFKQGWVQGIQALRRRAKRKDLADRTLRGMRHIIQRFLRP
jgi:hypothetical protein